MRSVQSPPRSSASVPRPHCNANPPQLTSSILVFIQKLPPAQPVLEAPSAPPALSSRPIRYPGDIALTCEIRIQLNLRPSTAPLPCLCNAEHKSSAAVKAVPPPRSSALPLAAAVQGATAARTHNKCDHTFSIAAHGHRFSLVRLPPP